LWVGSSGWASSSTNHANLCHFILQKEIDMSLLDEKKRLVLEFNAMRERWGTTPRLCSDKKRKRLWWEVPVKVENNVFQIKIIYPQDYPASPPDIFIITRLPEDTPHLYEGQEMCWMYPDETKHNRNRWSPAHDTAALAVGVAHRWFLAFLIYDATKQWPVPNAASH